MNFTARSAGLALYAVLLLAGPADAQGVISGCVTDKFALPLVAPWVVLTRGTSDIVSVADNNGCFQIEKVPEGAYTVRALASGFCDEVRTDVKVVANEHTNVDFALKLAAVRESITYAWKGWSELAGRSDAIVHVRVERFVRTRPYPTTRCDSDLLTEYETTALAVVKAPAESGIAPGPLSVLWDSTAYGGGLAIDRGKEFIAFLAWSPTLKRLVLVNGGVLVPVKAGAIEWVVGKDFGSQGKKVGEFLSELRALVSR